MRRPLALLVLTVAGLAQDTATLYRQAVDQQRQGNLAGAVQLYRQALTVDSSSIAARSNLGAALAGLGRYAEAIPEYEAALKAAPAQFRQPLRRNLGLAWYKSGHFAEATPIFDGLFAELPGDRDLALLLADCYLQTGEPAKAIRVLDPLFQDSNSAEGSYALGVSAFATGDFPSAVKAFQRAIAINPALPHIQSAYGQALLFTGDPDRALAAFRKQFAADPNDYDANYQSSAILARRGRHADALPLLDRAIALRPQAAEARFAKAQALIAIGRTKDAETLLETLVKEYPQFGAAHGLLADAYTKTGRSTAAAAQKALADQYAAKPDLQTAGLKPGELASHFRLSHADGTASEIPNPEAGKPAVLVFGSYSCPNFRGAAPVLNELAKSYAGRLPFLQVYIREAHATDQWQSTRNEREHIELTPATTAAQKTDYAMLCQRKLHLSFPAVVDGLDNRAEEAYSAWPSRVYVISKSGRVLYSSGLTEQDFDRKALEAALRNALTTR